MNYSLVYNILIVFYRTTEELLVYGRTAELKVLKEGLQVKMDGGFIVDTLQSICKEVSMDKCVWIKMVFQTHPLMKSIKMTGMQGKTKSQFENLITF